MTSRCCRVCRDFHPLDEPWPAACHGHFGGKTTGSIQIIKDIQPYKAVAVDKRTGKVPTLGSRREHREFLKANNYVEVGNDPFRAPLQHEAPDSRRDIKQAIDHMKAAGRWK